MARILPHSHYAHQGEWLLRHGLRSAIGARLGLAFDDRGSHQLKGVPDRWPVFAVRA